MHQHFANTVETITPRDEREARLIADHARDEAEQWRVRVGPLMRRKPDGKLIRLPDRHYAHTFDAPVACGEFLMGRGPGRQHGIIHEWIAFARSFDSMVPDEQARLAAMALHNEAIFVQNLLAHPPAPADAPKFAAAFHPIPPWARIHRLLPPAPAHWCISEGAFLTPAAA